MFNNNQEITTISQQNDSSLEDYRAYYITYI